MSNILEHPDANIIIDELEDGWRKISVEMNNPEEFAPRLQWTTRYPIDLIDAVLKIKGPTYLCDEIARDEDPNYVESDLRASVFGYVNQEELDGKRILDFGCGSGGSTAVIARLLPNSEIIGIELEADHLTVARARAKHYQLDNLTLLQSPSPEDLPEDLGQIDVILLAAVYEHLLPEERPPLLKQMWSLLQPQGTLFIFQTPDRRFPIETHTTGLPLLNYFPDKLVHLCSRFSERNLVGDNWRTLLRKGIRGGTPSEILEQLPSNSVLLEPQSGKYRQQSDIWYYSARNRLEKRLTGIKRIIILTAMNIILALKIPVAPYISIAIKKPE